MAKIKKKYMQYVLLQSPIEAKLLLGLHKQRRATEMFYLITLGDSLSSLDSSEKFLVFEAERLPESIYPHVY